MFAAQFQRVSRNGEHAPRCGRWIESPLAFGTAVDCGPDGEIFITGSYTYRLEFGTETLLPVGSSDIFVAELTTSGDLAWARSYGTATNEEEGENILSDGAGGVIVSGKFRGSYPIDFGGGAVGTYTDWKSAFLLFLDGDGAHRWSAGYAYGPSSPHTLARGSSGEMVFAGVIWDEPMNYSDGCVNFGSGFLCNSSDLYHGMIQTFDAPDPTAAPALPGAWNVVLEGNRPNPFNPRTEFRFTVASTGGAVVRLQIFDVAGRLVSTLWDGFASAGTHRVTWDGTDQSGQSVVSGTYYCRLDAPSGSQATKLSLVR